MFRSIVFLCFVGVISCTDFTSCGPKIDSVTVEGCPNSPCTIKRGGNVKANVKFTAAVAATAATVKVYGKIMGIDVEWPLPDSDACKLGITCPVEVGAKQNFDLSVNVQPWYPQIRLTAKFLVHNEKGENLFCFTVPVSLQ